ncbi:MULTISPECIES: M35 family metallo-endopeptidase [unclassified Luteibacter]|uniref:M35 family metallo-endopeptidase n=1 Tax=Luteibacter sp. PvP019 TaxID=3156436 RepID=UPI003390C6C8
MNAFVRTKCLAALGVVAIGWCGVAVAQQSPQVVLSVPSDPTLATRGVITFSITNPTNERIAIVSFDTPFATDGDRLANVEFEVLNPSNQSVAYQGRNVYFGPPDASSFVTLEPHQTLTKNVDLATEYGLSEGGSYKVTYVKSIRVLHAPDVKKINSLKAGDDVSGEASRSNTLTFYVDGSILKQRRDAAPKQAAVTGAAASTCTASQTATLSSDVPAATAQAYSALNHLGSTYTYDYDADGVIQHGHNSDPRYTYWFGTYDSSILLTDPSSVHSDNAQVDQVMAATYYRLSAGLLSFNCGCPGYPAATRAWSETGSPYLVHICDTYFTDPATGGSPAPSRVATLVHESSHFNDQYASGTGDTYYTSPEAHSAAISNRASAVRTAVNYEFYIMDATRK